MSAEVRLEELLGQRVYDQRGRSIGHLQEVRAEPRHGELVVEEYLIGAWGLLERLMLTRILRRPHAGGYRARWDQIEVRDPRRLTLTCLTSELERIRPGARDPASERTSRSRGERR